jgi:hypothetical protein
MNYKFSLLVICTVLALGSCASTNNKAESVGIGAAIGCATGSVLAALTDNDAGAGCAVVGLIGGIAGYVHARNAELEEASAVTKAASGVDGTEVSQIRTDPVELVDAPARKTKIIAAFKSVSINIPVSQVDTQEGREAIRKLHEYARKMADQRGETIEVTTAVALSSAQPGATRVTLAEAVEVVGKGFVRQIHVADPGIASDVQRITIEARNKSRIEV